MSLEELVPVGTVVRPHGLRGQLVVRPATDGSDVLLSLDKVTLDRAGRRQAFDVTVAQPHGKGLLVGLAGLSDRTAAEGWVGAEVLGDPAAFPEPEEGEFWARELVGLPVVSPSGEALGKVVDVETSPMQDWLVVERGEGRHLVPLTAPLAKVELEVGRVVVDAPEGLFEV